MTVNDVRPGHGVRLLCGGIAYFDALCEAIDHSRERVWIETYIFVIDASGERVAQAMERAAKRGVQVRLLVDGVGTPELPDPWQQRFAQAGVAWRQFSPLGRFGLLAPQGWRRLHRKLCVVDHSVAFCGGINLIDDLLDPDHGVLDAPRFDFAVQVSGPLVADISQTMDQVWMAGHFGERIQQFKGRVARRAQRRAAQTLRAPEDAPLPAWALADTHQGVSAALLLRDNLLNRSRIERAYRHAIAHAKHDICIANAYFLPGRRLRRALVHAAQRGVKVRLLVQGRYDNFMQFHASRPVLASLATAGIEIHEYAASLLHAKVAIIDGVWATVGSSNLDPLSLLLAREANVLIADAAFAQALSAALTKAMQTSGVPLNPARLSQRSFWHRCLDRIAFGVMRGLLFLTGFRY